MKLLGLAITNIRKIKAALFDFDGQHLVQIRGKNEAGKSSVIDAIQYLFRGTKSIPAGVITTGEDKGQVIGRLDEYEIERNIKDDGSSTVKINGSTKGSPQDFLDKLAGQFLDPEWFSRLSGKEQRETLLKYAKVDTTDIDKRIAKLETWRLRIGREQKTIGNPLPVPKVEEVKISDLLAERKTIEEFNKVQNEKAQAIFEATAKLRNDMVFNLKKDAACSIHKAIEELKADLKMVSQLYKDRFPLIEAMEKPEEIKPIDQIEEKIKTAESTNTKATAYKTYTITKAKYDRKTRAYAGFDEKIKQLRQQRSDMLNQAALPISGLIITDTGLSFKNITNDNWSTSQGLKIGLALAAHFCGELRTVYIKRGESLDADSLEGIKNFAEKKDLLIIMEVVDSSYSVNEDGIFYIEEGEIVPPKEVTAS